MIFSKSKTILSYRSHQNVKILSMGLIIYFLNSCGTQQEEWKTSESSPKNTPKMVLSTLSGTPSTAGDNATFTVSLLTRPGQNIVIDVSSSDTTLGTVSPDNLTFSKDNYTTAQTVTVTGQCDNQSWVEATHSLHQQPHIIQRITKAFQPQTKRKRISKFHPSAGTLQKQATMPLFQYIYAWLQPHRFHFL